MYTVDFFRCWGRTSTYSSILVPMNFAGTHFGYSSATSLGKCFVCFIFSVGLGWVRLFTDSVDMIVYYDTAVKCLACLLCWRQVGVRSHTRFHRAVV